ncbi:hypothetical protein VTO73DRAFT_7738 [Trametes versicolor]
MMADSDIFPIPKPYRHASAIYRTDQPGKSTLQEQMHLEDDPETFSEIMSVMQKATGRHVDIRFPYSSQDPRRLEEIREEILAQWPTLEEVYADAWPITFYLKLVMKYCGLPQADYRHAIGPGSNNKPSYTKTSRGTAAVARPSIAFKSNQGSKSSSSSLSQGIPVSAESSSKRSLRRSSRLTKKNKDVIDLTQDESTDASLDKEKGEEKDEVHRGEMSFGSHHAGSAGLDAGLDSDSDREGSRPLRFSRRSLNSNRPLDYTRQHAGESRPSERMQSVCPTLPRRSILSPNCDTSRSPSTLATGGTNETTSGTRRPTAASHESTSSHGGSQTLTHQSSAIEDMLLSRGLPLADAQRIALLFSSLGVIDKTYLRVFARLTTSREAWLCEMRQNGQLSEVQAWVVVDILDTAVAG